MSIISVKVAYGNRDKINLAIENGDIPKNTIIITSDTESELLYYDSGENLKQVSKRYKFETFTEAEEYIKKYSCVGYMFSIHNGSGWAIYIVDDDNNLKPVSNGSSGDVLNIKRIDGNIFDN